MPQGSYNEALADSGRSGDENRSSLFDVFACGQLQDVPLFLPAAALKVISSIKHHSGTSLGQ